MAITDCSLTVKSQHNYSLIKQMPNNSHTYYQDLTSTYKKIIHYYQ